VPSTCVQMFRTRGLGTVTYSKKAAVKRSSSTWSETHSESQVLHVIKLRMFNCSRCVCGDASHDMMESALGRERARNATCLQHALANALKIAYLVLGGRCCPVVRQKESSTVTARPSTTWLQVTFRDACPPPQSLSQFPKGECKKKYSRQA
jgi:hypothetical protein